MNQQINATIDFTFDVDASLDKEVFINYFTQHCKNFNQIVKLKITSLKEEKEIYDNK